MSQPPKPPQTPPRQPPAAAPPLQVAQRRPPRRARNRTSQDGLAAPKTLCPRPSRPSRSRPLPAPRRHHRPSRPRSSTASSSRSSPRWTPSRRPDRRNESSHRRLNLLDLPLRRKFRDKNRPSRFSTVLGRVSGRRQRAAGCRVDDRLTVRPKAVQVAKARVHRLPQRLRARAASGARQPKCPVLRTPFAPSCPTTC